MDTVVEVFTPSQAVQQQLQQQQQSPSCPSAGLSRQRAHASSSCKLWRILLAQVSDDLPDLQHNGGLMMLLLLLLLLLLLRLLLLRLLRASVSLLRGRSCSVPVPVFAHSLIHFSR